MSLLSINNIAKSYAGVKVLDGISLQINPGERIALIGDNGAGKTTLLRLIAGKEQPDPESGSVMLAHGSVIAYLEQQLDHLSLESDFALDDPELKAVEEKLAELELALTESTDAAEQEMLLQTYSRAQDQFAALDGFVFRQKLEAMLNAFSLDEASVRRPLRYLSGGERMRVALARLLLRSADLLLLDEPTNHLDQNAIEWLEDYLTQSSAAVLFVSHDRAFINNVAEKTLELNAGTIKSFSGNYTSYLEQKTLNDLSLERQIDRQEKKLERQAEITQTMLSHRKITQYHSSEKKEEHLKKELNSLIAQISVAHKRMNLNALEEKKHIKKRRNQSVISARGLSMSFDNEGTDLLQDVSFDLLRGQHLALVGKNGCGKTTLLRILMGELKDYSGTIESSNNLRFGYLGQEAKFESVGRNVLQQFLSLHPERTEAEARNSLAAFAFVGDSVFQNIGSLSGGERSRLFLCTLLEDKPDVIFLDEPTNHLDIFSRELLEDALVDFNGTVLAVSHDRYFINRVADEIWALIDGKIECFPDFQTYRTKEKELERKVLQPENLHKRNDSSVFSDPDNNDVQAVHKLIYQWSEEAVSLYPSLSKLKLSPQTRAERRRLVADLNQLLRQLESNLSRHQEEKESLEESFSCVDSGDIYRDYALVLETIETEEHLYLQLIELSEELNL